MRYSGTIGPNLTSYDGTHRWSNAAKTAFAEFTVLPGCPFIAHIHGAYVLPEHRNSGLGARAHLERLHLLRALGFTVALCTVNTKNEAELSILLKHDWQQWGTFNSPNNDSSVVLCSRSLIGLPPLPTS
jgi:L-amino acid N-acyltransferase YncA